MAGEMLILNGPPCFIDSEDGQGSAIIDGREWRWSFHNYLGPSFLKKDGELRKCQFPTNKKVWAAFQEWLDEYRKNHPMEQ